MHQREAGLDEHFGDLDSPADRLVGAALAGAVVTAQAGIGIVPQVFAPVLPAPHHARPLVRVG